MVEKWAHFCWGLAGCSWRPIRAICGHPALPAGPADGLGRLRSVVDAASTCSQLVISTLHVVAALRTAFRVGALRPLWTLSVAQ